MRQHTPPGGQFAEGLLLQLWRAIVVRAIRLVIKTSFAPVVFALLALANAEAWEIGIVLSTVGRAFSICAPVVFVASVLIDLLWNRREGLR
jgi:hypothetical protein